MTHLLLLLSRNRPELSLHWLLGSNRSELPGDHGGDDGDGDGDENDGVGDGEYEYGDEHDGGDEDSHID